MADLAAHCNVFNTALVIARRKGWELEILWPEGDLSEDNLESYQATKDGWVLVAYDPIQLLGLIAIHEHVGPKEHKSYWWSEKNNGEQVLDELIAKG